MNTRSINYTLLLRDLARQEPRHGFSAPSDVQLTNAQAAIVVREFPDVVGEALAGTEGEIAQAMASIDGSARFDIIATGFAANVMRLIRERCAGYILSDLQAECDNAAEADASDREYERGVLA
jgi:hypothetical protein